MSSKCRRTIYYCSCAWNECTLRSYKEPRKCTCEQNNPACVWIPRKTSPGQKALDRGLF